MSEVPLYLGEGGEEGEGRVGRGDREIDQHLRQSGVHRTWHGHKNKQSFSTPYGMT